VVDRQLDKRVDRCGYDPVFGLVMNIPPPLPGQRVRRLVIWGAVAFVLSGLAYGVLWLLAASHFRAATLTWIEQRRAEGYQISFTRHETSGFPSVVRITLADPAVAGRRPEGSWSWSGDAAVVEIGPLDPEQVTVRLAGQQGLQLAAAGRSFSYEGSASELTINTAPGGWLPAGAVTVRDLVLRPVEGGDTFAAARIDVATRGDPGVTADDQTVTYELTLDAAAVQLPRTLDLPLGDNLTRAALTAKLVGTLEAGPWPEALDLWRDAGGTLEVSRLQLLYGPLTLTADGTLALDEAKQPIGAFNARIVGASRTVDALRQRGLIEDMNAAAAKVVLGLMARNTVDDKEPVVAIPLTLQDRTLHAGPIALAVIPEIRWRKTERKKP